MNTKILSNLVVCLSLLFWSDVVYSTQEKYAPNEIIVKFRTPVAERIEQQSELQITNRKFSLSDDLDRINTRYRVRDVQPILKNFRQRGRYLRTLQEKKKTLLTKREKRILNRLEGIQKAVRIQGLDRIYRIKIEPTPNQSLEEMMRAYKNDPNVEYAELNPIISINSVPNDALYSDQWSLEKIQAPSAWDTCVGYSETIVAVLDTGVDYTHRDLRNNMWINEAELNGTPEVDDDENGYIDDVYGYNFIYNNNEPMDDQGHGTHCAGIIAAEGNNGLDISGICWTAKIMAIKFLDLQGDGTAADAAISLHYAVENGAQVISNSWGSSDKSNLLEEAINYAHSQGAIIVAAAGNDNSHSPCYPAGYEEAVIAVAATEPNDDRWTASNYGNWIDIAAPGESILSLRALETSLGTYYDVVCSLKTDPVLVRV
ncbi:MAG: S8 family peptidase [Planctomycetota bacterium]|jgi:subtilisin family serine protease